MGRGKNKKFNPALVLRKADRAVSFPQYLAQHLRVTGDPNATLKDDDEFGVPIEQPLLHASLEYPNCIKQLITARADLEQLCHFDGDGRTVLMWAAVRAETIDVLRMLMDAGASMTSSSTDSYTGFGLAAARNNLLGVKEFIKRGVDVNMRAVPSGHTPLIKAAEAGNLAIVILLHKSGADINARSNGKFSDVTALAGAASSGHALVCDYLLRNNADPSISPNNGLAPLHQAVEHNYHEVVKLLLQYGASPINAYDGSSALFTAAKEGCCTAILDMLLEAGCDINKKEEHGFSPLHAAVIREHSQTIAWLLAHGADINSSDANGRTPLRMAAEMFGTRVEAMQMLLAGGADVNKAHKDGGTPLFIAAQSGDLVKVKHLLKAGADPLLGRQRWSTPLHIAAYSNKVEVMKTLLEAGVPADACSSNHCTTYEYGFLLGECMPLALCKSVEAVALLLEHGADVNHVDENGANCLHYAAVHGVPANVLCKMLLAGADPTQQSDMPYILGLGFIRHTPAKLAQYGEKDLLAKVLLKGEEKWAADGNIVQVEDTWNPDKHFAR